jgi:hypothetical protein
VRRHELDLAGRSRAYGACQPYLPEQGLEKAASYPVLEIIAKLAAVLEVEPAELLKVPSGPRANPVS